LKQIGAPVGDGCDSAGSAQKVSNKTSNKASNTK
jgi:hypothetical protein